MSQTPQDTQPQEQTEGLKQYHTPEFRDYGTVQDLTQASVQGTPFDNTTNGGGGSYLTNVP